jgi:hypothetical protein
MDDPVGTNGIHSSSLRFLDMKEPNIINNQPPPLRIPRIISQHQKYRREREREREKNDSESTRKKEREKKRPSTNDSTESSQLKTVVSSLMQREKS